VTKEALLQGRNRSRLSLGYIPVAELTLDTLLRHVYRVGKGDGLWWSITQAKGRVGKPGHEDDYHHETHDARDAHPGQAQQ
jgi:hypothetical protein